MRKLILLIGWLILGTSQIQAQTLSTSFVDVLVTNVPLGAVHTVEDDRGRGIVIHNRGESAVSLKLFVSIPSADELKEGEHAIPDVSWIRFEPSSLLIPANSAAECRVILEVPKERKFRDKMYHSSVWIQSEPSGKGNLQIRASLKSRLRFKTARK